MDPIPRIFISGYVQPARDCHNCGMAPSIEDQVVDFFGRLFGRIFSEPFEGVIEQRLKRNAVIRQVEESADAASQSVARFFLNEKLTLEQVTEILSGFGRLSELLKLENITNPNITPESVVENLLPDLPCPAAVEAAGRGPGGRYDGSYQGHGQAPPGEIAPSGQSLGVRSGPPDGSTRGAVRSCRI